MSPLVKELRVGQVRHLGRAGAPDPMDRPWTTGIFKEPVEGEIWLGVGGLAQDEVGDTKNHGGPEKALFAYPSEHYVYWNSIAGHNAMTAGGMGENMAMKCMMEDAVCIGDVYQFGGAVIQVSQPRQPCWKPARRFRIKDLALQIQETGRTGWYFRVLQEGSVRAGVELELIERLAPAWTIAQCNHVMHKSPHDLEQAAELAAQPHLAVNWKRTLENRLTGIVSNVERRVFGPNAEE